MLKLKGLEILVERVGNFSQYDGPGVLDLFLCEKRLAFAFVTTIWAVTRRGTFNPGARRDFEIPKAILNGAFSAKVTLFVRSNRDAELTAEIVEIACTETPHGCLILLKHIGSELCSQRTARNISGVLVLE